MILDIDECDLKLHNCGSRDICVNTRGNFKCIRTECPDGYTFVGDVKKYDCFENKEINFSIKYNSIKYLVQDAIEFMQSVNTETWIV